MGLLNSKKRNKYYYLITTAVMIAIAVLFVFNDKIFVKADGHIADYSSVLYDVENKLGSSEVNAICQTNDGYIWVGTYSGLFQYDGNEFKELKLDDRIHSVMCLLTNGREGVWIGTNNRGLFYYNYNTKKITCYTVDDGLAANSIRSLCYGKSGELYIGTSSYLSVLDSKGVLSTYEGTDSIFYVTSLSCRADGTIGGVTNSGTVFLIREGLISQTYTLDKGKENYSAIEFLTDGSMLLGTSDGSMYQGTFVGSELTLSLMASAEEVGYVSDIYQNDSGEIIVAGENGVGYFDGRKKFNSLSSHNFNSSIGYIFEDSQNNYWITSTKQGLLKLSKNPFTDIFAAADVEQRVVNSVIVKGNLYYVACDDGLVVIDKENECVVDNPLLEQLEGVRIRQVYEDSKGNIWFSTYGDDGLVLFDGNELVSFNEENGGANGNRFRSVLELSDGTIVAASTTGLTFIRDNEIIKTLGADDGIDVEQILSLYEDADGTIYAGSDGGGVYIIRDMKVDGVINEKNGLLSLVVMRIVANGDTKYFITGDCIYAYRDEKSWELDNFPYSNNYDMFFVPDGRAWVTSGAGIFIVDMNEFMKNKNYVPELINKSSGLNTRLTSNSWNCIDGEDVILCCNTGVMKISSVDYNTSNTDFQIRIGHIDIDGRLIDVTENGEYQISASSQRITFCPAVLNYSLSNPLIKMYLEGFEDEGITVRQSELSDVSYTNLKYGNYTFHLQVINPDTGDIIKDYRVFLHKEGEIYQKVYFWIGAGLAILLLSVALVIAIVERKNGHVIKSQLEQIKAAKEEAERTSKYKTQFLANMSHEVRTPINTIMGMDELILREDLPSQVRQYANDIYASSTSLLSIVDDILDLSKIESGKMNIVFVEYDLAEMLTELGSTLKMRAEEKKLKAIFNIDPSLPRTLYGDRNRLKQVILNLITNATKYTDTGSVEFKMSIVAQYDDRIEIKVEVKDTGIGIKEEDIPKLFEEFQRFDEQRNSKIKGTGLGLSITKQLLTLMGSKIEIESEYNRGSNFFFTIRQRVIDETPIDKLEFNNKGNTIFEVYKPTFQAPDVEILVVDDTPLNLAVIRGLLRATKVHVDTGENGLAALERVKHKHYDLILLDHMMPEMDGVETLQHLIVTEHMCKDVPVIVLTANAIAGAREKYLDLGFTDYLSKPVSGSELEEMLRKYLPARKIIEATDSDEQTTKQVSLSSQELHYIDMNKGINFCAGDKELYMNVLQMFVDEFEAESRSLSEFYEARDSKNYVTHAHKLKSSSRTIGADELFEKARELETDGKNDSWDDVLRKQGEVIQLYLDVVEEIKTKILEK